MVNKNHLDNTDQFDKQKVQCEGLKERITEQENYSRKRSVFIINTL